MDDTKLRTLLLTHELAGFAQTRLRRVAPVCRHQDSFVHGRPRVWSGFDHVTETVAMRSAFTPTRCSHTARYKCVLTPANALLRIILAVIGERARESVGLRWTRPQEPPGATQACDSGAWGCGRESIEDDYLRHRSPYFGG